MKKLLSVMAMGAALASTTYADIARVEGGVGAWMQKPSGSAHYNPSTGVGGSDTLEEKQKTQSYAWILIKHPIPVIPNIRLEYSKIEAQGKPLATWGSYSFGTAATSKLDVTQYDIIPYYNLLDNTAWVTVDVGLDVKLLNAKYTATEASIGTYEYTKTIPIPMAYLRGRVEIPMTGIGVEVDGKYVTYSGSTFYDARAKIDYTFDSFPIVQPAIEVGYREEKVKIDSTSVDVKTDIKFAGMYVGAMLRF